MKLHPNLIPRFNIDYNSDDLIHGIETIFSNSNPEINTIIELFGKRNLFFINNGRSSLYVILKSLNFPKGSKIGVPLYSCTVVFDAIIKAGYDPCFIDIDISNYTLDPRDLEKKIDDIKAVVVIHTFGRPADMDEIKKAAKGIPIIEDCAHSLMSEYKGKKTGTIGNASFFSLAKYISAGGGGMIILNDDKFDNNIRKEITMLNSPTKLSEIRHTFYVYMYSILYHKPWFGGFAFQFGSLLENSMDINNKKIFKITKINNSDLKLFIRKLKTFYEKVELQRTNSFTLLNELKNTNLKLPYERKNTWCNYFLFPILFENKMKRDKASEDLKNMGVDTAKLFSLTPLIAKQNYDYKGDCPNAEDIADRVLIIPNYYSLSNIELLKIVSAIKKLEN